jgi:hypothetical protein
MTIYTPRETLSEYQVGDKVECECPSSRCSTENHISPFLQTTQLEVEAVETNTRAPPASSKRVQRIAVAPFPACVLRRRQTGLLTCGLFISSSNRDVPSRHDWYIASTFGTSPSLTKPLGSTAKASNDEVRFVISAYFTQELTRPSR